MGLYRKQGGTVVFVWVQSLDMFFGRARTRFLGLGLMLAWVYGSWFSGGIFPSDSLQNRATLCVSLAFSAVGLLALAFRPRKRVPLGPIVILGSSAVVSATTLLFYIMPGWPPLLAVSALGGLASSTLWVAWGELFCEIGQEDAESCIPASLAVFVAAALLTYLLPWPSSGILAALYPLVSCVMLLLGKNVQAPDFVFPSAEEPFKQVLPSLAKLALCSMTCSIATGFVVTSFAPRDLLFFGDDMIVAYAFGGVIAGCVAAFAIAHASRLNFSFLYELVIPLIVFSLSLRSLDAALCNTIAFVLACTATLYVEVLFFAIFARITAKGLCLPSETFGIFRSVTQLGFLLGGLLGSFAPSFDVQATCLFLICVCVVMLPLFVHLQKRFDEPVAEVPALPDEPLEQGVDAIARVSDDFKLSARETEVLGYLGKGRSVPYMRETMTISKSTIETHIKHIYAKTDVHSKQELIDLIESYRADADLR